MKRNIVVVDAPSNLGLRPSDVGVVPGCYKLPWALRNHKLLALLNAEDGGAVIPPRYQSTWQPGDGDRNADAIADYSVSLADRLAPLLDKHDFALVLGGDCSILIGHMLALKQRGRYGLIYLDAHGDFRHPGNAPAIDAAAGEDLAIITGRGDARLVQIEQRGPYVLAEDVHVVGVRENDDYRPELVECGISVTTSAKLIREGAASTAAAALATTTRSTRGFWLHLDLDVVDEAEMPAADSPEPNGPSFTLLSELLGYLLSAPQCIGMEVTIYDPDLDPGGKIAERIVQCLVQAFARRAGAPTS